MGETNPLDDQPDEDSESAKPKQAWQRRSIFNSYGLRRVDKTDEMDEESSQTHRTYAMKAPYTNRGDAGWPLFLSSF